MENFEIFTMGFIRDSCHEKTLVPHTILAVSSEDVGASVLANISYGVALSGSKNLKQGSLLNFVKK